MNIKFALLNLWNIVFVSVCGKSFLNKSVKICDTHQLNNLFRAVKTFLFNICTIEDIPTREFVMVENIRLVCVLDLTADFGVTTIRWYTLEEREKLDLMVSVHSNPSWLWFLRTISWRIFSPLLQILRNQQFSWWLSYFHSRSIYYNRLLLGLGSLSLYLLGFVHTRSRVASVSLFYLVCMLQIWVNGP